MIPLCEAAMAALLQPADREGEGTVFRRDDALDRAARTLATKLPIFGVTEGSSRAEQITRAQLRGGTFQLGASRFVIEDTQQTLSNLRVRQRDFVRLLAGIKRPAKRNALALAVVKSA